MIMMMMKTRIATTMTDKHPLPILGLGNDIIEIERIHESIATHQDRFLSKLFTLREQEYCLKHHESYVHFAGRFAAKEAIAKALGTGFGEHLAWHDIEVLNGEHGKPVVVFSENANHRFGNPNVMVSISHCRKYASAVAIWVCAI